MTKTLITAAATLLLALGGTACLPEAGSHNPTNRAIEELEPYLAPTPDVASYHITEDVPNIDPPTRLDITGTLPTECDDMGGTFRPEPGNGYGTCEGVDY